MYMKKWGDNFKQTLRLFAFTISKILAYEQVLIYV